MSSATAATESVEPMKSGSEESKHVQVQDGKPAEPPTEVPVQDQDGKPAEPTEVPAQPAEPSEAAAQCQLVS